MYTLQQYEALNRWVYEQLIRNELPPKRRLEYMLFLAHNDKDLLRKYATDKLCPNCGASIKNWQEVFGEEHICKVSIAR